MPDQSAFRAVVKTCFEITGRGTVVSVEIVAGIVVVGDRVVIPTLTGPRVVEVRAVDFVDYDVGRPTHRAEIALTVGALPPTDVAIGQEVRAASVDGGRP